MLSFFIILKNLLSPIRTFAKELGVNNVTIINAYKQLEISGYVTSKPGSGFFVSKQMAAQAPVATSVAEDNKVFINFSSASPHPGIFPTETFKAYCVSKNYL